MRKEYEAKLTMYKGVDTHFDINTAIVSKVAALLKNVGEFKSLLSTIKTKAGTKDDSTTGKTQAKYDAQDKLIRILLQVGPATYAFANSTNDALLREKSDFTKTGLRRLRDMDLVTTANALYDAVQGIVSKMTEYNITSEIPNELKVAADKYENSIGSQGSSVSQHSTAVMNLAELFRAVDTLLTEQLDPLVQSLERTEPVFAREYRQTRIIKDHGVPHKQDKPVEQPANTPAPTN
jgi:hypothetical protein